MLTNKLTGAGAADKTYIEDVFSTYLYTGTGTNQTINNGIDLAGKGGMVWLGGRGNIGSFFSSSIFDTERGTNKLIRTNSANPQATYTTQLTAFNSNGFSYGNDSDVWFNNVLNENVVSWTFRKAPKFFDVVTYTGNGVAGKTISHSLGQAPGMIVIKAINSSGNWAVYHRSVGATGSFLMNNTNSVSVNSVWFNNTEPTSTTFTLGSNANVNYSGWTYVAYLFAHDTTTDGLIQCGTFTGEGTVTLGWEPQFLLIKNSGTSGDWRIWDNMRGLYAPTLGSKPLMPNLSSAEDTYGWPIHPTATGFQNASLSGTNIYMAIRRGPMRTPTDGTKVFQPKTQDGTSPVTTGFVVDNQFWTMRDGSYNFATRDRLRGGTPYLITSTTSAEASGSNAGFDSNTGVKNGYGLSNSISYYFRRAPGFFDVVCDTGTGTAKTVAHNLGVAPDLIIRKSRNVGGTNQGWWVYTAPTGNAKGLYLNNTDNAQVVSIWNSTTPTATVFSVDGSYLVNQSGTAYVSYLFASCPGVSKVGSYTGNGSSQTINCGFSAGARFILIKRTDFTDSTGNWYVWDSARGIVAGYDPHLSLNTTAAEVTSNDSIDPDSTGFIVNQVAGINVNVSGATYIYLAIA